MKTLSLKIILLLCLFFSVTAFSQETEIVKLLNKALKEDFAFRSENHPFQDTLKIIKPYTIANGVLSVEVESKNGGYHYIEKQEVPLSKIIAIGKDINVIFDTKYDAVKISVIYLKKPLGNEKDGTKTNDLFFTGVRYRKQNQNLGEALQNAFRKAGYGIDVGSWYD